MTDCKLNALCCADEAYVQFHDECWGVPVYSDKYSTI